MTAPSGEEALRLALKNDFAVILLDVRMPGIDGFETARLIRNRERSSLTPIIFLTAAADEMTSMFRGYEVGAVDYLHEAGGAGDPEVEGRRCSSSCTARASA